MRAARTPGRTLAFLALVVAMACGGEPGGPAVGSAMDARVVWQHRLPMTEELRIDGTAELLTRIDQIAVSESGTVAIAQPDDLAVALYDSTGTSLGTVGREGQGPGEFRQLWRIGFSDDSLWVYDSAQRRLSTFAPDLSLAGSRPFPRQRPDHAPEGSDFGFIHPFADGTWLVRYRTGPRGPDGTTAYARSSDPQRELGSHACCDRLFFFRGVDFPVYFATLPLAAHSPDGRRVVIAKPSAEGSDRGTVGVAAVRVEGDTVFHRNYPVDLVPIPEARADSVVLGRLRMAQFPGLVDAFLTERGLPSFYPPVDDLVVGRDGTVWMGTHPTDHGRRYLVLNPRGEPLGHVLPPSGGRIGFVGRSRVWVVETSPLGVESVVRYRVEVPGPTATSYPAPRPPMARQ